MLELDRRSWVTIARLVEPDYRESDALYTLEADLMALAENQGQRPVVLNCASAQMFSSTFVSRLLTLRRKLIGQGSQLVLCDLSESLTTLLERLRLSAYFRIFRDEREALAELGG
jgi:anti-anti-sigma regulatory factor